MDLTSYLLIRFSVSETVSQPESENIASSKTERLILQRQAQHQAQKQRQIPQQRWQIFPSQLAQAKQIAEATALSPLLAQVLINRGLYTPEQAWEFLDPETLLLPSPLDEFPDLDKSLDLLIENISRRQKILICGDYDADGMTSTALLMRSLRYLGAQVDYAIPSRMDEGYGINLRIVEEFHAAGGKTIITVDNGIAAYEPIARAVELGLTVVLTDHHAVPEQIPPATAILNPQLIREVSPYRGVAGVGVAYILAVCLAQRTGKMQDLTATLLALFTLGTIADLAPLTGVNRRWVRRGLTLLPKSPIAGIQALIEVAGLSEEATLKPEAIGFRLGPRINAVGRIDDPQIVIDLLTTDDIGVALQRAMQCEETNKLRRQLCETIELQAIEWCEQQQVEGLLDLTQERVLVVVQPEWHHGVIGIVASRLVERYGVPVFIGTYEDKSKKEIRGSARSIPEFNVVEALRFCDDLLDKYGGHRAAGGFSFPANKLRQVKSRLSTFACQHLQLEHLRPLIKVDVQAAFEDINIDLFSQMDRVHPCGIENPDPVFWTAGVKVIEQKVIGKTKAHLKLTVAHAVGAEDPVAMKAIAWRWGEYYPLPRVLDIAYKLRLNEWKGNQTVELEIVGVRSATDEENESFADRRIQPWSTAKPLAAPKDPQKLSSAEVSEVSSSARYQTNAIPNASRERKRPAQVAKEIALGLRRDLQTQQQKRLIDLPDIDSYKLQETEAQETEAQETKPQKNEVQKNEVQKNEIQKNRTRGPDTQDVESQPEANRAKPSKLDEAKADKLEAVSKATSKVANIGPTFSIDPKTYWMTRELEPKTSCTESEADQGRFGSSQERVSAEQSATLFDSLESSFATDTTFYVEFYFSQRYYKGRLVESDAGQSASKGRSLAIENAEGHLLVVRMSDRQGFLYLPLTEPQPVDISELKYFNLVRAGLSAIELKQKTQLLMKQDELLAEKDSQIATMKAQIKLLEEKITQLSTSQQQQFASLETERLAQESAIQGREAQIQQLQLQVSHAPLPNDESSSSPTERARDDATRSDVKQQVRKTISDGVWFCLQAASQKDLQAAYQNYQRVYVDGPEARIEDYSAAGDRLASVVNREVAVPFFEALQTFIAAQNLDRLGNVRLGATQGYRLGMMPPLLASQWRTFSAGQLLERSLSEEGVSTVSAKAPQVITDGDRDLLQQFLTQWEHPMATCLSKKHRQAASSLDQIAQLHDIAIRPERCLYRWQYELLHQLIAGSGGRGGLLREIFAL